MIHMSRSSIKHDLNAIFGPAQKKRISNMTNNTFLIDSDSQPKFIHKPFIVKWLLEKGFNHGTGPLLFKKTRKAELTQKILALPGVVSMNFPDITEQGIYYNGSFAFLLDNWDDSQLSVFWHESTCILDVEEFLASIKEYLHYAGSDNEIAINYYYMRGPELRSEIIYLDMEDQDIIYPELYPTIDINALNCEFKENKEKLLILYGDPGVGKTTFVRYMLRGGLYKTIGYVKDKTVMRNGEFWSRISDSSMDLIIFDDLDDALEPRKNNKEVDFVNNLLSYTDGILNKKSKIVITTNQEIDAIDSALLRPGRCFDFIVLPPLSREEALEVWTKTFKCPTDIFDAKFDINCGTITQAALVSELRAFEYRNKTRTYLKNSEQYSSLTEKIRNMGIRCGKEAAGFRS